METDREESPSSAPLSQALQRIHTGERKSTKALMMQGKS